MALPQGAAASQLSEVITRRRRAPANIDGAAVTAGAAAERGAVLRLLNEAPSPELPCTRRYRRQYLLAAGLAAESAQRELRQHPQEEPGHADRLAARGQRT
jgi:bacterioferritin